MALSVSQGSCDGVTLKDSSPWSVEDLSLGSGTEDKVGVGRRAVMEGGDEGTLGLREGEYSRGRGGP